jgi:hypothetical protein
VVSSFLPPQGDVVFKFFVVKVVTFNGEKGARSNNALAQFEFFWFIFLWKCYRFVQIFNLEKKKF